MKVYTRTGDDGTTGLIGGTRVKKFDLRLEAYGTVDELNSYLGLIRSDVSLFEKEKKVLIDVQSKLFVIGGLLATDNEKIDMTQKLPCSDSDIEFLEKEMDRLDADLPQMTHFILPGGNQVVSFCHIARTVCRRAERRALEISDSTPMPVEILKYLNRLSDYLFVLSRKVAFDTKVEEIKWIP